MCWQDETGFSTFQLTITAKRITPTLSSLNTRTECCLPRSIGRWAQLGPSYWSLPCSCSQMALEAGVTWRISAHLCASLAGVPSSHWQVGHRSRGCSTWLAQASSEHDGFKVVGLFKWQLASPTANSPREEKETPPVSKVQPQQVTCLPVLCAVGLRGHSLPDAGRGTQKPLSMGQRRCSHL